MNKKILLIGPGNIGLDYVKVLQDLQTDITVIGRSAKPNWPLPVYEYGIDRYIESTSTTNVNHAIVAVDESQLYTVTKKLILSGIKNILVEKPAGISKKEVHSLKKLYIKMNCNLFVAYNRRFYQSVKQCREIISKSDGPISVNFSFTEWPHTIDFNTYSNEELDKFVLCNSSHVPDTVFYLVGKPRVLNCETYGQLDWHKSACVFQGNGITKNGVLINYNANWKSAGRWGIEICLPGKKLILRPLEKLHIQYMGSVDIVEYDLLDEEIDVKYKPGLYEEVKSFLNEQKELCTIEEQVENFEWFYKMANYK